MARVLVTGNGGLGTTVLGRLASTPGLAEPLAASRAKRPGDYPRTVPFWRLDVADAGAVERVLDEARPDVVIHTAAMTNVDGCERERERAEAVNTGGARNLARACAARGIHLVQVSTDYVFDGTAGPYAEDDPPNPLGWYARTKYRGELAVAEAGGSWSIARTAVPYGYPPQVRVDFIAWLVGKLRTGERVSIVTDQVASPTLADNLAEMLLALGLSRAPGVFHTAGASVLSRYEFARLAAETFDLDASLIDPVTTASLGQLAPRPLRSGLEVERFRSAFRGVSVLSAAEGLIALRRQAQSVDVA